MTLPEIRQFDVIYGRSGEITSRTLCNGTRHFPSNQGFVPSPQAGSVTNCDNQLCLAEGSSSVGPDEFGIVGQFNLGLVEPVPAMHVLTLISTRNRFSRSQAMLVAYGPGENVALRELAEGVLLPPGTGVFITGLVAYDEYDRLVISLVRNQGGKPEHKVMGKPGGRWSSGRVAKYRTKLIKGQTGGTVTTAYQMLIDQLMLAQELAATHPGPEVDFQAIRIRRMMHALLRVTTQQPAIGDTTLPVAASLQAEAVSVQLDALETWLGREGLLA